MPQIINRPTFGADYGEALGGSLYRGLRQLSDRKMQQLMGEEQRRSTLPGLLALGYDEKQAEGISRLDPELQKIAVKAKLDSGSMGGMLPEEYVRHLNHITGAPEEGIPLGIQSQQESAPGMPGIPSGISQEREGSPRPLPKGLTEKQYNKLADLELKKQEIHGKAREHAFKETKDERADIINKAKGAREDLNRLGRIKKLDKEGKIQPALLHSALKLVGLDIPSLQNADTQELEKLSTDFLKGAKNVFGSRITNADLTAFMKTVPSLAQTKEGRSRVIRNLELLKKGELLRDQALRDVLKENKNIPPLNLMQEVEDRIQPSLDKLSREFIEGSQSENLSVGSKISSLPSTSSLPVGARIRRKDGVILENNGSKWVEV